MPQTKWEHMLTLLFVICSVILILLMGVQFYLGKNFRDEMLEDLKNIDSADFSMQAIPSYHFNRQNIETYVDLVERPLFFKGRRPVEISEIDPSEQVNKVAEKIDFSLIGIIDTPGGVYSLFLNSRAKPGEGRFSRFKKGDDINGRMIKQIKPDRVIIASDNGTEEILLAKPRPKRPVVKPRAQHKANLLKQKNLRKANLLKQKLKMKK